MFPGYFWSYNEQTTHFCSKWVCYFQETSEYNPCDFQKPSWQVFSDGQQQMSAIQTVLAFFLFVFLFLFFQYSCRCTHQLVLLVLASCKVTSSWLAYATDQSIWIWSMSRQQLLTESTLSHSLAVGVLAGFSFLPELQSRHTPLVNGTWTPRHASTRVDLVWR